MSELAETTVTSMSGAKDEIQADLSPAGQRIFDGNGSDWPSHTDAQLIELYLADRSQEAISQIVHRYGRLVYSVASRVLENREDCEDVFQATFAILCVSARKIKKTSSLGSYLYGVAHRTAKRVREQRLLERNRVTTMGTVELDALASPVRRHSQENKSGGAGDVQALEQSLLLLPDSIRIPIIEHHLLGLSVPQIASKMALSVSSVEGRIKRGKRKLQSQLRKFGIQLPAAIGTIAVGLDQGAVAMASESCVHQTVAQSSRLHPDWIAKSEIDNSSAVGHLVLEEINMSSYQRRLLIGGASILASAFLLGGGAVLIPKMPPSMDASPVLAHTSDVQASPPAVEPKEANEESQSLWKPQAEKPKWLAQPSVEEVETEALRTKLRSETIQLNFNGRPLSEVLATICNEKGIPLIIDQRSLEEEGVAEDEPVSLIVAKDVSLNAALNLILQPLNLCYKVDNGLVTVASNTGRGTQSIRTYDLTQILPSDDMVGELVQLIENVVTPDHWERIGGEGTINVFGSLLVVNATENSHLEIEKLFQMISRQEMSLIKPNKVVEEMKSQRQHMKMSMRAMGMGGMGMGGMGGMGGAYIQPSSVPRTESEEK